MNKTTQHILDVIAQTVYDKKGFNILGLDLRDVSTMADYVIIAEGNIARHVKALSVAVRDKLEEIGHNAIFIEGTRDGDWIVMDYSQIVLHLFIPEYRERYGLEELWKNSKIIDLNIKL